jgi:hypothetical protein
MSFVNVPLQLLQKQPQNVLGSLFGGVTGGFDTMQRLRAQLLANRLNRLKEQAAQTQLGFLPQKLQTAQQQAEAEAKIKTAQAGIAPQLAQAQLQGLPAKLALIQAQTEQAKANADLNAMKAHNPFMAVPLAGPARNVNDIKRLREAGDIEGADRAQRSFDAQTLIREKIGTDYKKTPIELLQRLSDQKRALSEGRPIEHGINTAPMSNQQMIQNPQIASQLIANDNKHAADLSGNLTPDQIKQQMNTRQKYYEQYLQVESAISKQIADPETRKAARLFGNLLDEINKIDFAPIASFAGAGGLAKLKMEKAKLAAGKAVSDEFKKYQLWINSQALFTTDSLRQALQTSVREGYVSKFIYRALQPQINTLRGLFETNPALAMQQFNSIKSFITGRYSNAIRASRFGVVGAGIIRQQQQMQQQSPQVQAPQQLRQTGLQKDMSKLSVEELQRIAKGGK